MPSRSAFDVVGPAFIHARQQLFPMRWSQWWRIGVIGLLTGEMGSFGCGGPGGTPSVPSSSSGPPSLPDLPSWAAESLPLLLLVATLIGLFIYALIAAITYINSICRFILIETVVSRRCEGIRVGWRKWRAVGRRFFFWQLALQMAMLTALMVLIGVPMAVASSTGMTQNPEGHVGLLVLGALAVVFIGLTVFVTAAIAYVTAKDFVAPVMAVEQIGVADAWRQTLELIRADRWGFVGYFFVKILLSIVAGILLFTLLVALLVPLVGGGALFYALGAGTGASLGALSVSLLVVAALVGVPLLIAVVLLANVPVVVFFPLFALYFLAARYPELEPWLMPSPTAGRESVRG